MSRRIYCQKCGEKWKPHAEDTRMGWQHRIVNLVAKAPDSHCIKVNNFDGVTLATQKLTALVCDLCGVHISDGSLTVAITMWREAEIAEWEGGYGVVIPEQAMKLVKVLTKDAP